MSNFAQRFIVALIGIPIVYYIVMYKPLALLALMAMLAGLCVHEYYGLAKAKGFLAQDGIGILFTILVVLSFAQFRLNSLFYETELNRFTTFPLLEVILVGAVITVLTAEMFRALPNPFNQSAITLSGIIYIGIGLGAFYGIREYFLVRSANPPSPAIIEPGPFLFTMLAAIWICDSAGYFGGKAMGKNKLFERVSPNKTWEGAAWGLVFAFATFFAARAWIPGLEGLMIRDCIVMGIIVGVFGQIGDLAESMLKRDVGVKDSSHLIPGHGGVLDRLDSILFVSPLTYLYLYAAGV